MSASPRRIVVGVTGASGAAYARRLLECLAAGGAEIHLVISPYGRRLFADELGIDRPTPEALVGPQAAAITAYAYRDVGARLASGSFLTDAMIVCPCSCNTLGDIAAGTGANLISRAAAVHLKEARRLVLVPREMPFSQIDLRNMLRVSRAGGIICPASPGFYTLPRSLDDIVDFVVGKLCDLVGVPHDLNTRWVPPTDPPAARRRKGESPLG
jgi:4-hydroxy-3-polyprenylbenzoate decarboxylase